jgi:PIN domain nuclease of toxin-antitoxin system
LRNEAKRYRFFLMRGCVQDDEFVGEITIKVGTGRLVLPDRPADFVNRAMRVMSMRPLDITHLHALALDALPEHHGDPFDRLLIAQAITERMTLLTADRALQKYEVDLIFCGK